MEISGSPPGIQQLLAAATRSIPQPLQVGQTLQASVIQSSASSILLAIGDRQLKAETSLAMKVGQQLTLQVRSLGDQPVLRIITALAEPPRQAAIRLLLPKQGALTPILASLRQLSRAPNLPVPRQLSQTSQAIVQQLADVKTISTPAGLQKAILNSGNFLESSLLKNEGNTVPDQAIRQDFKAGLLRLVQQLRNWPGNTSTPATAPAVTGKSIPPATATTAQTSTGGVPAAVAGSVLKITPGTTATALPGATPETFTRLAQTSPDQLQRAIRAATDTSTLRTPVNTTTAASAATANITRNPVATAAHPIEGIRTAPPPQPGAIPVAQAAQRVTTEMLNQLVNLRTDLLQQTESALARLQLHQLASLPREAERGLLEWLFELPVRHREDIDLWSFRIAREAAQNQRERPDHQPQWSVQIAIDLPGLGPLQVRVQLHGEQISTRFWAESESTLPLLREHLPELRQTMTDAGLDVADLDCQAGPLATQQPKPGKPLINETV